PSPILDRTRSKGKLRPWPRSESSQACACASLLSSSVPSMSNTTARIRAMTHLPTGADAVGVPGARASRSATAGLSAPLRGGFRELRGYLDEAEHEKSEERLDRLRE